MHNSAIMRHMSSVWRVARLTRYSRSDRRGFELILFDRSTALSGTILRALVEATHPQIRQPASVRGSERRIIDSREARRGEANAVRRLRNCVDARALHEGSGLKPLKKATTVEEKRRIPPAPLVPLPPPCPISGGFRAWETPSETTSSLHA